MEKTPLRMCIACREMKPKEGMVRVVKNKLGEIFLDIKGNADGRGAYLCGNAECVKNCLKRKIFNKAFSCAVPPEIYQKLSEDYIEKQ